MPARNIIVGQKVNRDKLQRARELRREMTPEEKVLWERLRAHRLGAHFRRQVVIDGYIVDFYCHSAGLVVEVEGGIHLQTSEYDAEREKILTGRGLKMLRVTNEAVSTSLEDVLARIAELCHDPLSSTNKTRV